MHSSQSCHIYVVVFAFQSAETIRRSQGSGDDRSQWTYSWIYTETYWGWEESFCCCKGIETNQVYLFDHLDHNINLWKSLWANSLGYTLLAVLFWILPEAKYILKEITLKSNEHKLMNVRKALSLRKDYPIWAMEKFHCRNIGTSIEQLVFVLAWLMHMLSTLCHHSLQGLDIFRGKQLCQKCFFSVVKLVKERMLSHGWANFLERSRFERGTCTVN